MGRNIEVVIDDKEVKKALNNLLTRFKDMKPILSGIQAEMFYDLQDHFKKEVGPQGAWDKLKPSTLKQKAKKGHLKAGILRDTGILRNSLLPGRKNSVKKITAKEIAVGTNLDYAGTHNEGLSSKNIPKREFMYLTNKAQDNIGKMVLEGFVKEWNK